MFEQVERQVGDYVEWLRLLVEALGALVIAAGVVLVIAGLVRHLLSQLGAAFIGMACFLLLGPGYLSAGTAMVLAIVAMILCDAVHPPAVATALSFGLKAGDTSNLVLFCLALGITAVLLGLQRLTLWLVVRSARRDRHEEGR